MSLEQYLGVFEYKLTELGRVIKNTPGPITKLGRYSLESFRLEKGILKWYIHLDSVEIKTEEGLIESEAILVKLRQERLGRIEVDIELSTASGVLDGESTNHFLERVRKQVKKAIIDALGKMVV